MRQAINYHFNTQNKGRKGRNTQLTNIRERTTTPRKAIRQMIEEEQMMKAFDEFIAMKGINQPNYGTNEKDAEEEEQIRIETMKRIEREDKEKKIRKEEEKKEKEHIMRERIKGILITPKWANTIEKANYWNENKERTEEDWKEKERREKIRETEEIEEDKIERIRKNQEQLRKDKEENLKGWENKSERDARIKRENVEAWKQKSERDREIKKENIKEWMNKSEKDEEHKEKNVKRWEEKSERDNELAMKKIEAWKEKSKEDYEMAIERIKETKRILEPTKQEKAKSAIYIAKGIKEGLIGSDLLRARTRYEAAKYQDKNKMKEKAKEIWLELLRNEGMNEKEAQNQAKKLAHEQIENMTQEQLQETGYTPGQMYKEMKKKGRIGLLKEEMKEDKIKALWNAATNTRTREKQFLKITEAYIKQGLSEEEAAKIAQTQINTAMRLEAEERNKNIREGKIIINPGKRKAIKRMLKTGFGNKYKGKSLSTGIGIV